MAKNLYETADDTLRGEASGQLSPEAQKLWDQYNSVYGNLQNTPMRDMRLRSGATMQIMDPSIYYKQRALQNVLKGMTGTGLGTRNAAQPGALSQLAPFISALGSDPKFQKWLSAQFGGSGSSGLGSSGLGTTDWGASTADPGWGDYTPEQLSEWEF